MKHFRIDSFMRDSEHECFPRIDLYETENHLVFEIELPGIDLKDVSVQVVEQVLIVEGKYSPAQRQMHEGAGTFLCMERHPRTFRRILNIPIAVEITKGSAFYKNGVITIQFPKLKGKRITIPIELK